MRIRHASVVLLLSLSACASAPPAAAPDWKARAAEREAYERKADYVHALAAARQEYAAAQAGLPADSPGMMQALLDLGSVEARSGLGSEAEAHLRMALDLAARQHGAESLEAAQALRQVAASEGAQAKWDESARDLKAALAILEKLPAADAAETARTRGDLAMAEYNLGDMDAADADYKRALAVQEQLPGEEGREDLAETLTGQGLLFLVNGDNDSAGKSLDRALKILDQPGKPATPTLAYALDYLGNVNLNEGRNEEALALFQRALKIDEQSLGPDSVDVANALNDLARCYDNMGVYAKSVPLYQRSIATYIKVQGEENGNVSQVSGNLAGTYDYLGDYARSEALYRKALALDEKLLGPDNMQTAYDLNNMAVLYRDMGRFADAIPLMERATAVFQKIYPPDHPNIAIALSNLAVLYAHERDYAKARDLAQRALAMSVKTEGHDHPDVAARLNVLAEIAEDEKHYPEAEKLYKESVAVYRKTLGPGHTITAQQSINLGKFYGRRSRFAEAAPLFDSSLTAIRKANGEASDVATTAAFMAGVEHYAQGDRRGAGRLFGESLERLHQAMATQLPYMNERDRLQFLANVAERFPEYYSYCVKYHGEDPGLAGRMYDVLLWQKGLVGGSIAALRAKIAASGDPEALALLDKLSAGKTRLATLLNSPGEDRAAWQAEVQRQQAATEDLERALAQRSAALSEDRRLQAVTWEQVRDGLKPGEAAVEMVRFPYSEGWAEVRADYYVALVVTRETRTAPQLILLGKSTDLEAAPVADYATRIRKFGAAGGHAFYDAFWKPLEPALAGATRVYLAADGVLNQASLGIVADGQGRLLLERYDLELVPSTRDVLRAASSTASRDAVLMGGPDFALKGGSYLAAVEKLGQGAQAGPRYAMDPLQPTRAVRGGEVGKCPLPDTGVLCPLPGAAAEVDGIGAELTRARWQPTLYRDDQALEEAVKQVRHPRVLHLATHGFFLPDQKVLSEDPMLRSGLYFAGADNTLSGAMPPEGADDGVLTAYEATQLDLEGTELVVLSACDTGLGTSQSGEGVFGLNRALQEAGAQAVLMSMWSVPDQETRELMQLFYKNWLSGMEKHEALRQAELAERDVVKQRYGHDLPYYWGAFVMVGR
ncbi:MAG TPA: CHAT domain-containing tetratricopeptide repeat protein [Gammaproteobacteria bacterium]